MEDNGKDDAVLIYLTDGYGESDLGNVANKHQGTIWVLTERKSDLSLKDEHLPKKSLVLSLTNK